MDSSCPPRTGQVFTNTSKHLPVGFLPGEGYLPDSAERRHHVAVLCNAGVGSLDAARTTLQGSGRPAAGSGRWGPPALEALKEEEGEPCTPGGLREMDGCECVCIRMCVFDCICVHIICVHPREGTPAIEACGEEEGKPCTARESRVGWIGVGVYLCGLGYI